MEASLSSQPVAPPSNVIALHLIFTSPHQLRHHFDEESLVELARSMKEEGLIQPIVLRQVGNAYELVAGERRLRAAEKLGWKTIEARIIEASDESAAVKGLIENLQRAKLSPVEEAKGYRQLMEAPYNLTCEEIARRVGKTPAAINRALATPTTPKPKLATAPEKDPLAARWPEKLPTGSRVRYKGKGRWQISFSADPHDAREALSALLLRLGKSLQKPQ